VKKKLSMLMLASFMAFATGALLAQQGGDQDAPPPQGDQSGAPPQGGEQGGHWNGGHGGHGGRGGREGRMDPSARTQMLTERLNLTKDQQSKVKDIYSAQQQQMQSLMQDQSMSQQDKRAKFEQMRTDTDSQVRAVLTGDQQQKFDAMLKEREQHSHNHKGRQGGEENSQPSSNQ
jgi:periplasmic protein CpxP/Spy